MNAYEFLEDLLKEAADEGISVNSLCYETGIDPSLVSRWRHKKVEPRLSSMAKLREGLEALKARRA